MPFLVAVVALAGDGWHPTGDMAQAELHVRGFVDDPPLLGAAGRLGTVAEQGSHPGPAAWFALLPGYRLLGQTGWALQASVALVSAACAVAAVAVARRRGGDALAVLVALALLVLARSNGLEVFTEPWNPWLAVLPFALFVLLVWSVLCDDRAALPWAAVAGAYALQCHVGYALLVGGLGALAAAWAVRRRWWRPVAWAAGLTVLLWVPPVLEQLTADDGWPGNLRILWRHFSSPSEDPIGVRSAVEALAGELNAVGPWIAGRGHQPTDDPAWLGFAAMVAVWAGAVVVARRRRLDAPLRLHAVLAVACALGVVSMARVFGGFFDYVIRWMWALAALVAVAIAWTAWLAWPDRQRLFRVLALGGLGVALVMAVGRAVDVESSGPRNSDLVAALTPPIAGALDRDGHYLVRWDDTVSLGAVGVGTLLELERRGFDVGADPYLRAGVLPHRVIDDPCRADAEVRVVIGPADRPDGGEEVAEHDARTPQERARFERIADRLDRDLPPELVPVDDQNLIAVSLDPRLSGAARADVQELIDLGLPARAYLAPVQGCDP